MWWHCVTHYADELARLGDRKPIGLGNRDSALHVTGAKEAQAQQTGVRLSERTIRANLCLAIYQVETVLQYDNSVRFPVEKMAHYPYCPRGGWVPKATNHYLFFP